MPITPGQTYRSADPRELIRIRIKSYTPGENRALVVDAATGKRPRPMLATALHESPTTQAGKPRRSGYVLEEAARTASGQQPETCSVCGCPFPVGHICRGPAVGQPAEAQATDEAQPPRARWRVEHYDPLADEWIGGIPYQDREKAVERLAHARLQAPRWADDGKPVDRRLVRETTTWTVEDETR